MVEAVLSDSISSMLHLPALCSLATGTIAPMAVSGTRHDIAACRPACRRSLRALQDGVSIALQLHALSSVAKVEAALLMISGIRPDIYKSTVHSAACGMAAWQYLTGMQSQRTQKCDVRQMVRHA